MFSGTLVKVLRASHCPPAARLFSQRAARSTGILSGLPERVAARIRPANCSSPILSRLWNNAVVRTSPPHRRNFSSTPHRSAPASELPARPILSGPPVGGWLLLCSTLVFTVIVVGGVTRLTESGLSITEWKPVTGILPPLSRADWEEEFDKYKSTPEYKMLNAHMSVEDFKDIYYMEWGHRILGRIIGVGFIAPLAYFALKKHLSPGLPLRLSGLAILLGAQGVLGWYMVKSGLNDDILTTPGAVPRVSQYRLASHLGTALALYAGMFYTGIAVMKDWKFAHKGTWAGLRDAGEAWKQSNKALRAFKRNSVLLTALVFLTAFSGAFVAGLDAGLLYNEFPMMGGSLHPPADELIAPAYSGPNGTQSWRNIFENPTTVQFDHRVLGVTTWATTGLVYALTFLRRKTLPPAALRAAALTFGMANIQAVLGISTLLYLVPVPLAASHQAGSIMLLSAALHMILAVRKPGAAAQAWRAAAMSAVGNARAKKAAAESVARTVMAARSGPMSAMKGAGAGPAIAA